MRGYLSSDLPKFNHKIRSITCPFSGEILAATPALQPDLTILHALRSDTKGNVLIRGIIGVQKEAALAAKSVIVTVEEIVPELNASVNDCVLPSWTVTCLCRVPRGAQPSYAHGYYDRDNAAYKEWDKISRDRTVVRDWMDRNVLSVNKGDL
jgi:glutaconate CoA-transferase subunit A